MEKTRLVLASLFLLGLLARSEGSYSKCPNGWAVHYSYCFKVFDSPKSFYDASRSCNSQAHGGNQGRLATFYRQEETKFVQGHMGYRKQYYWIGVHDPNLDGHYEYIVNTNLHSYHPWSKGQPDNYKGLEHCVMMYGNTGKWNDYSCGYKLPYVCQMLRCFNLSGDSGCRNFNCRNTFPARVNCRLKCGLC